MEQKQISNIVVKCPHCKIPVLIEKLNCCIFRHASFKTSGKQIEPHADKILCDYYIQNDLVFGCCNPFQVIVNTASTNKDDKYVAIKCDYI